MLTEHETNQVNGGFFYAAVWVVRGAAWAYRNSGTLRCATQATAGGALYDAIKDIVIESKES